jgi:myo-inositol-1(or 4)-monophosphatase
MQDPIASRFEFARSVILDAGALANEYFGEIGSLDVKSKGPHDVVSEADLETEILIRGKLLGKYPEDAFFGEETGLGEIKNRGLLEIEWVILRHFRGQAAYR